MDERNTISAADALRVAVVILCLFALAVFFWPRISKRPATAEARAGLGSNARIGTSESLRRDSFPRLRKLSGPPPTAEEIVAAKLVQFSGNRRKLLNRLAQHAGKPVPPEVER